MRFYLVILTLLALLNACQRTMPKKQKDYADLSLKIDSTIKGQKFNGVILVSVDSADIYSKAIGFSDLENETPMHMNDQFVIGSISKQITAVLVLREYEKGKIGLNDAIGKFLTEIDRSWANDVTIHQLLTHTHGIVDTKSPLNFKPGLQFQYSQLGYELLAQILQKVSGKSFQDLATALFDRYGLKSTFHPNSNSYKNLVKGYEENEKGNLEYTEHSLDNYAAAGSFVSNVHDLKKWNQLHLPSYLI